jgi:serine/threonine protein phosphatase PrpC
VDIDLAEIPLLSGDHLLVCSDGLHTLPHTQIAQLMEEGLDPQVVSEQLIALSKTAGSVDDTTAVVLSLTAPRNDLWTRLKRRLVDW